ncbi:uncharacterized protein LOC124202401 [Daphnia pulex]|uniref:uncharacterized protein LOC124202401 n=1 Tax=Daphnia pulex TaxID=6669 RepID=UPI001EDFC934|nr:uncharacterized protein LOC124202401 [Daphnia pulex]
MTTTIAPMAYTSLAPAYGVTNAPYVAGPMYAPQMSAPIPLSPVVMMPESLMVEDTIGESGLTKLLKKAIALPLAIVLPIVIPLIVIIKYLVTGGSFFGKKAVFGVPEAAAPINIQPTTPFFTTPFPTTTPGPYNGPQGFYSGPGSGTGTYGGGPVNDSNWSQQKRRETSSGLPSMSVAQVERLTQIVFAAMRSEECIQRLLCELGSMSKSFSDTAHSVAVAVESFVPESIKASYDVFAKAEKCDQYVCGSLQVKK